MEHLCIVRQDGEFYKTMVQEARTAAATAVLCPQGCTTPLTMHSRSLSQQPVQPEPCISGPQEVWNFGGNAVRLFLNW